MTKIRGFEPVIKEKRKCTLFVSTLPTRATKRSAAYDFYSNYTGAILPGDLFSFWTDVKAYMQEDEVLEIFVRSSIGIKKGLVLANGTGIIDSDYYSNPDNDGNICICLYNRTNEPVSIEKGERIAQGIFKKYLVADNGNSKTERSGGIGSTDEK